jgi:acetyltransferase
MTIRNLDRVLAPRHVAVIGASGKPRSVGHLVLANMRAAGFAGTLMPVNPHEPEIDGLRVFPDIASLPEDPDLAIIATPPDTVPGLIAQLAARGCAGAVVITAGFGEGGGEDGLHRRQAMLDAARPALMRIIGPNCLGLVAPGAGVNASFGPVPARAGGIACFTQSGAVAAALMDRGYAHAVGFRYLISLGDMADVDFGDLLDFVATDPGTKAVLLYVESITSARKFMSAARAAARGKPVIVVKSGRHPAASAAARSHTGALAGSDAVYEAAFRRAGLLRVQGLGDLFSAAETLSRATSPRRGESLAILTNGGGFGVLATDAWLDAGGTMAELSKEAIEALDRALPSTWSHANPIDIIGDAGAERYQAALTALLTDRGIDTILALNCPTGVASSTEAADGLLAAWSKRPGFGGPNLLACWLTALDGEAIRARLAAASIPAFETIESAIAGCAQLAEFARNQRLMLRVPALGEDTEPTVDTARAQGLIDASRRPWMDTIDAKGLIAAHGIPTVPILSVSTPEEAGRAAEELGGSVALKLRSSTVLHKSDVGGVVLDLSGADAVRAAAESMLERIEGIEGFTVEAMAQRPDAFELIIGASVDPTFGPVILFGQGGVGVEAIGDTTLALPPLDLELARGMIGRTRIARLLRGFRGRPAVNMDALAGALVAVSRLMLDHPEVVELDINPILADSNGVIAVDARVRLDDPALRPQSAIVPYPREMETTVTLRDGTEMHLRPIRPDDATVARRFLESVSREDIRARFHGSMRDFSGPLLIRLTQIDYDREMALIGFRDGDELPLGVVRIYADPDGVSAEFAILVRSDVHGHGLGTALMHRIIEVARGRGLSRLVGSVLRDNTRMLRLVREMGFVAEDARGDEVTMVLRL